jgi:hypothetical protein
MKQGDALPSSLMDSTLSLKVKIVKGKGVGACSLVSQPQFGQSVRMRLTLPKVGTWSPPGLPQLQSSTAEGKTPRLEVFFIPLKRSQSVDVQNGLA